MKILRINLSKNFEKKKILRCFDFLDFFFSGFCNLVGVGITPVLLQKYCLFGKSRLQGFEKIYVGRFFVSVKKTAVKCLLSANAS